MSDNDRTANRDLTRRDFVKAAGTVTTAGAVSVLPAPAIRTVSAAGNQVLYGSLAPGRKAGRCCATWRASGAAAARPCATSMNRT